MTQVNTDRAFISLGIAKVEQMVRCLKAHTPKAGTEEMVAEMIATYEAEAARLKATYGMRKVKALA